MTVDRGGFGRYVQSAFMGMQASPADLTKVRREKAAGTENE